jgi:glyoxylase-like metal-dependent hydrolase (beta-lactamase superfamily II)
MNNMVNVYKLEHNHTQSYIIKNNDNIIMVDAGYPESFNTFSKILSENEIKLERIKFLIITHFHPDHAGLTQYLKNNGTILLLHECQIEYISWINKHFEKHIHKKYIPINKDNRIITTEESKYLLQELGFNGLIISTPGHTEDSISIIIENMAFIGDLPKKNVIKNKKNGIINNSWEKIFENNVNIIYPGHGIEYKI